VTHSPIPTDKPSRRRALILSVVALLALSPRRSQAEPNPADDLFQQGKALMATGQVPEACQKFVASLALSHRGGTLLNLAVCREQEGRYATALRLLSEARELAARDHRGDRVTLADEHLASVRPKVSWVTLTPQTVTPYLVLFWDDQALPRDRWGLPQAVDPGSHTVAATAPGRARFEIALEIAAEGQARTVSIPTLSPQPTSTASSSASRTLGNRPTENAASETAPPHAADSQHTLAWASLALSGALLTTGAVLGLKAIADSRLSRKECPGNPCPDAAYQKNHDALIEARLTDVAIPAGALAAGFGLYLLLHRPSPETTQGNTAAARTSFVPTFLPNMAGVTLQGPW
jgi:tetratricopeptide (TPR) repeat protein